MDIFVLQSWEYERNAFADGLPASELTSHSSWESALYHYWRTMVMPRYADLPDVWAQFVAQADDWPDLISLESATGWGTPLLQRAIDFLYEWLNDEMVNAGWSITCLPRCSLEDSLKKASLLSVNGRVVSQWGHGLDSDDDNVLYYRLTTVDQIQYEDTFDRNDLDAACYVGEGTWEFADGTLIAPMTAHCAGVRP